MFSLQDVFFFVLRDKITDMVVSIAEFEGFFIPNSVARRNNNPGNLKNWDQNLPKDDQGFDIFPSESAGWNALFRQVIKNVFERNLTVKQFFCGLPGVYGGYDPGGRRGDDAGCTGYANFVRDRAGLGNINLPITEIIRNVAIDTYTSLRT